MTSDQGGTTALDRLRTHYEDVDMTCPKCGYVDEDGKWQSKTDGSRILYKHICPSCGENRTRTITVEE